MSVLTVCGSIPSALASVTDGCLFLGEVQRIYLQRTYSSGTTLNKFTIASANPNLIASWTSLLAASDGTKILAPKSTTGPSSATIHNPVFAAGEVLEWGGDGESADGIPWQLGTSPGKFEAKIVAKASVTIEGWRATIGEQLSAYFELADGRILGATDSNSSPTIFKGIKIQNLFVGMRQGDSKTEPGYNMISFYLPWGWDSYLMAVTPSDFTARNSIVNS